MAAFEYEALDSTGKRRTGLVSAENARLARRELRRMALLPLRLDMSETAAEGAEAGGGKVARSGMKGRDLVLATRQLATLLSAGAPVEEALRSIAMQADRAAVRRTLMAVREAVIEGASLSEAMAARPRVFPPLYRAMVAAGENAGTLGVVLERQAALMEKRRALNHRVMTALTYPALLALTAIAVVIVLMVFIVPKVVAQFETMGQSLPPITEAVIALSAFLGDYGAVLALALVAGGLGLMRAMQREVFAARVDGLLLRLPLLGRLIRSLHAARMARTLGTLLSAGVPAVEAMTAAAGTVRSPVIRAGLDRATADMREGAGLARALKRTGLLPPLVAYMAAVGESSGQTEDMLARAADYLESEFESVTQTALSLLEPLIIIVMGLIVATVVLAILMPILQLNSLAIL